MKSIPIPELLNERIIFRLSSTELEMLDKLGDKFRGKSDTIKMTRSWIIRMAIQSLWESEK